jgi:enterochelin esterase-like enzyme
MDCKEARMKGIFTAFYIIIGSCLLFGCNHANYKSPEPVDAPNVQTANNTESQVVTEALYSKSLEKEMYVSIYLPPGYNSQEKYPVLYVLYGYGGNHGSWFNDLKINLKADQLIQSDQINPLIIVSPDYGNSFGVNTKTGEGINPGGVDEGNYEDYLVHDLVSYVDNKYNTITTKDGRYIGGSSMGGYGALYLGFTYPDLFSKVGGHSSAIWNYTNSDQFTDQRDWLYANDALRNLRDPFILAKNHSISEMEVYLDAGDQDLLAEKNQRLYEVLVAENISTQWHLNPGGHNPTYWISQLDNYLLFYASK